jgi:hypothetical protein
MEKNKTKTVAIILLILSTLLLIAGFMLFVPEAYFVTLFIPLIISAIVFAVLRNIRNTDTWKALLYAAIIFIILTIIMSIYGLSFKLT